MEPSRSVGGGRDGRATVYGLADSRGGVNGFARRVEHNKKYRDNEQEDYTEGAEERRGSGRKTLSEALVERIEENGENGGPGQGNEKGCSDEEDEVAEQEQRTVGEDGG